MNEHENESRLSDQVGELRSLRTVGGIPFREKGDLVVDLSGTKELNLTSLALLLTAQQKAEQEDRKVWLAGVPIRVWQALNAMGLGGFFHPFPVSRELVA